MKLGLSERALTVEPGFIPVMFTVSQDFCLSWQKLTGGGAISVHSVRCQLCFIFSQPAIDQVHNLQ